MSSNKKLVWRVGDEGYINGRYLGLDVRIMYRCTVLETGLVADKPGRVHEFTLEGCHLKVTRTELGFDGSLIEKTWRTGKPVPMSALRTSAY